MKKVLTNLHILLWKVVLRDWAGINSRDDIMLMCSYFRGKILSFPISNLINSDCGSKIYYPASLLACPSLPRGAAAHTAYCITSCRVLCPVPCGNINR